jgi:hypothetical protein
MSTAPIITFKAGQCLVDVRCHQLPTSTSLTHSFNRPPRSPTRSSHRKSQDTSTSTPKTVSTAAGNTGDSSLKLTDLVHFCWRKRDAPLTDPEIDLVMVPTDGTFVPYEYKTTPQPSAKTNGRIFALKFASSPERHLFWLQSKPQGRDGDPTWFSPRDRKIGDIVNRLLQGEEVNVTRELARVNNTDDRPDDEDEDMEDAGTQREQNERSGTGSGGAGADATGGDVREEGEGSREGGADGARA